MIVFQYIYYFFRSLYYRGFYNTYKLLNYENRYEKQLGINTHSIVNLNELTLAGSNSKENHHYQGASYYILFSLLNKMPEQVKQTPFIDFGCGKGRAIFVAEQCGFTNLIGVDIAQELITDALDNLNLYKPIHNNSRISFIFSDATTYVIPTNACVFYFFNPFGETILHQVLQNIKLSVQGSPREIYCLYLNPLYKQVFESNDFKIHFEEKNKRYTEAIVYTL